MALPHQFPSARASVIPSNTVFLATSLLPQSMTGFVDNGQIQVRNLLLVEIRPELLNGRCPLGRAEGGQGEQGEMDIKPVVF